MTRPARACAHPGCTVHPRNGTHCRDHKPRTPRPSAAQRGYNAHWRRTRTAFLRANPTCVDCHNPATVADHDPVSRRDLVTRHDPNPDAWHHLQPRCASCHSRRTGHAQPGGWHARQRQGRPQARSRDW